MNLKMIIFCFLMAGVLFSSGCTEQLSSDEIYNRLILANSNLNTYAIDMKMTMDIVTEASGALMDIKYDISTNGDIDRTNKRMALKGTVRSEIAGMTPQVDTETYLVDGYLYTKNQGTWVKMEFGDDTWARQDKMSELVDLIQSGNIERLEDESFGGSSYYVIKINPDLGKVVEHALRQQQSASFSQNIDYDDAVESYSSTIWVNKNTFVIEKSKTEVKIAIGPEDDMKSTGKMEMTSVIELVISNINKDVNIVLPEEAYGAMDIADLQKVSMYDFS